MVVKLGQQCNVREKPTVILYTYIYRHAGTPKKNLNKQKHCINSIYYNQEGFNDWGGPGYDDFVGDVTKTARPFRG